MSVSTSLDNVFSPITVGTLRLDRRLVVPPHGGGNGNLLGSDAEFGQHCALWLANARGGMQWLGGALQTVQARQRARNNERRAASMKELELSTGLWVELVG